MKVSMTEQTARKTLAVLPPDTQDPDLQGLRFKLEQQLRATTNGGHLVQAELDALIAVARYALNVAEDQRVVMRLVEPLNTAIPKLEALLARAKAGA